MIDSKDKKCIAIAWQDVDISVPITLKPKVNTKDAVLFCCGNPILRQKSCQDSDCRKSGCGFVLAQNICIEIPIEFSADAIAGCAYFDCDINNENI